MDDYAALGVPPSKRTLTSYDVLVGGDPLKSALVPTVVPGLSNVMQLTAGWEHTLALHRDGTVSAFGRNGYGQLGLGPAESFASKASTFQRVRVIIPAGVLPGQLLQVTEMDGCSSLLVKGRCGAEPPRKHLAATQAVQGGRGQQERWWW